MRFEFVYANADQAYPRRVIESPCRESELEQFAGDGFLVLRGAMTPEQLHDAQAGLARVEAAEAALGHESHERVQPRRFGGRYLQNLFEKDPAFSFMLRFEPVLSIARGMLGPLVSTRPLSARVTEETVPGAETHWHQHLPVAPRPLPRWHMRPHSVEALFYLDAVTPESGSLMVLPGSHERVHGDFPPDSYDSIPGEVAITCHAGDVVLTHGALWHRARPAVGSFSSRRMLMLAFQPAWLKRRSYDESDGRERPPWLAETDPELEELLGLRGFT